MRRTIIGGLSAVVLVLGAVLVTSAPAGAATGITATSVALSSEDANCTDADLDLGMVVTAPTTNETGLITNAAGDTLGQFDNDNDWNPFDGVYAGYGQPVSPAQAEGTVIGSYASIGSVPFASSNTAEWFVLYECSDSPGGNIVLYSCYGDLGTCPTTAVEALALLALDATLDPSSVVPGGTVTVNGTGCFDALAGALLLKDGSATGVGDTVAPNPDGTFSIPLVVPADATVGGAYSVQVDCGNEQVIADTVVLPLQVVAPTTTTTAPAVEVTPAFTG
jgi:hypothetical protein